MSSNQLENITLSKLLQLTDPSEYEALLYVKEKDVILGRPAKPLENLTFSQVIDIRETINTNEGLFNAFKWVFNIEEKELLKVKVLDFYPALNHILKETKQLVEAESELGGEDKAWTEAGGGQLAPFGIRSLLITLGQQFSQFPDEVAERTYGEIFVIAKYNSILSEVQKNYQEIKAREAQRK